MLLQQALSPWALQVAGRTGPCGPHGRYHSKQARRQQAA